MPYLKAILVNATDKSNCMLRAKSMECISLVGMAVGKEKFRADAKQVLSVAKALSIQAHPDKELARVLHKLHPDLYKDGNHKPEMALAITHFEALCGFINLKELKAVFHTIPEVVELVGPENANLVLQSSDQDGEGKVNPVLQVVFTHLMSADEEIVTDAVNRLKSRLHSESEVRQLTEKEQLVLRLEKQYPADIGVIAAFFLNHVKLNPGKALFLGVNEPRAYLSGECIECMATSDNVVRAGLTPKLRDVQTLCSMLTYKQRRVSSEKCAELTIIAATHGLKEACVIMAYR